MSVKAKFTCNAIVPVQWQEGAACVYFNAIYSSEGENADFATATPTANLSMVIAPSTNAATYFEIGRNYYLTFEAVQ